MTALLALVLGLIVGSFLNVVIARVPSGQSIVRPGSHCPHCGHVLAWYENIPLLSWAALRGRCRSCRAPISLRYPAVELLTGLLFLAAALLSEPGWQLVRAWLLIGFLVPLALIDLEQWIVPVEVTVLGAVAGLLTAIPLGRVVLRDCAIGAAGGFLFFWGLEPVALILVKALRRMWWAMRVGAAWLTRTHPVVDAACRLVGGAWIGAGAGWLFGRLLHAALGVFDTALAESIDAKLERAPWFAILGLLVGLAAGIDGALRARRRMGEPPPERQPDPTEALGGGDKWLLLVVGAFLGWRPMLGLLLLSTVQGALAGIILLLVHGRAAGHAPPADSPATEDGWTPEPTALPFGPWIALAALELFLLGPWFARTFPSPLVTVLTGQPWRPW